MGKKSDLEILKPPKRVVRFKDKEYQISELNTELGLTLIGFLGQVDYTTQGKVTEFIVEMFEKNQENPEEIDIFTKDFIAKLCILLFSFINKHTRDYFYEFIAVALTDEEKGIVFTDKDTKKLLLKEAMKILNTILFDEDAQELIKDSFFLPKGAKIKAGQ